MVTLRRENACRFRLDDPDEFSLGDGVRALKASGTRPDDRATAITALKAPGRPHYASSTANTTLKAPGRSTGRASLRSSSLASLARAVLAWRDVPAHRFAPARAATRWLPFTSFTEASSGPDRAAGPFHSHPAAGRVSAPLPLDGPMIHYHLAKPHASPADSLVRSLRSLTHESLARLSATLPFGQVAVARAFRPTVPNRVTPPRAPEPPRSLPGSGAPVRFPRRPRTPSRRTAPCCRCPRRPRPGPASARRTP